MVTWIPFLHLFHDTYAHMANEDKPPKGDLMVLRQFWALKEPVANLFEEAIGVCVGVLLHLG